MDRARTGGIDLNADLGESFGAWRLGDDAAMFRVISSANVACGFHAGDPLTMRACARLAVEHGVAIGAHPGYRDLAGFGRRAFDVAPGDLAAEVAFQLGGLEGVAVGEGTRIRYVKAHGALYHRLATDAAAAAAVVAAVGAFDAALPLLGLAGSELERAADAAGIRFVREAFADRAYAPDGSLVPRSQPDAVVHDVDEVVRRAVAIAAGEGVEAVDGSRIDVRADSLCVHGDTPDAARLATAVRAALDDRGIVVEAPW